MTELIRTLESILNQFDVAVLDQWGVLHNGSVPYPYTVSAMRMLQQHGKQILIVSNSGKRAELNRQRIENIGLPADTITKVVTSGEALWEDVTERRLQLNGKVPVTFFPICAKQSDPIDWAAGSDIEIRSRLDHTVDAILLMGLPDGTACDGYDAVFAAALKLQIPVVCSNPDKSSPRADGLVTSPGALAHRYEKMGGVVLWYGKPHAAVYRAVVRSFPDTPSNRFLMVGDSLEHDIAGAQSVGFLSVFIRRGIHADDFSTATTDVQIEEVGQQLVTAAGVNPPDFSLEFLR
jgi:HAD superfamily hydrolase (TIGR01459 family)